MASVVEGVALTPTLSQSPSRDGLSSERPMGRRSRHRASKTPICRRALAPDEGLWRFTLLKRIRQLDSRPLKICDIAGHESKVVDESDGRDLLVERVSRVRNPQMAPDLGRVRIKSENAFAE